MQCWRRTVPSSSRHLLAPTFTTATHIREQQTLTRRLRSTLNAEACRDNDMACTDNVLPALSTILEFMIISLFLDQALSTPGCH
jgi:hypothetical protein